MDLTAILRTALAEHDGAESSGRSLEALKAEIEAKMTDIEAIPSYSPSSDKLSLVSFRCMLQDTGYPMEVYMPAPEGSSSSLGEGELDLSRLRERWIGWGVEVPGEQSWVQNATANEGKSERDALPKEVHSKFPLAGNEGKYLGALVKVYDENVSFKPATVHTFVGVLSTAALPSALQGNEEEAELLVPALHVLKIQPPCSAPTPSETEDSLSKSLINYLSTAFNPPDRLAAELLFLSLLSSPSVRPTSLPPLGTLSLNFLRKDSSITEKVESILATLTPQVVKQSMSLPLLHSHPFSPASSDASLNSGLLQLAPGTVLLLGEDEMGQGGQLQEKAIKNLRALMECAKDQTVRYEYPYMDGLKMECSIRVIVLSEGKSLIPVDINLPLAADPAEAEESIDLPKLRQYLASRSSPAHATKFNIPDDVAQAIQDDFVSRRKGRDVAEEGLKRRMRLARLMALSRADACLTQEVWDQVVDLDQRIEARLTPTTAQ